MIMYKKLYFVGFAIYAVLFVFSLQFAKERILFIDMASNLFYIIVNNGFAISHYRFGDMVSQSFPLLGIKSGLQLSSLINLYSACYIVYSLAAYIVCGSILKRYDLALVVLLQNVLFSSDTFYVLSQLPQSITLLLVVCAMVEGRQLASMGWFAKVAIAVLLVTIVFFHPVSIFVMLFCVGYFMLEGKQAPDRRLLVGIVVFYFAVLLFKFLALRTPYESHSMSGLKNFVTQFPDYITLYSNRHFLQNCLTKYYWIPIIFVLVAVHYIRRHEKKKLWFFVLSVIGYLGLVDICYPTDATPQFYIENIYLPLSVFLSVPFVLEVLPAWGNKQLAMGLVALISVTGLVRIYATHTLYTARLNAYRDVLHQYGERKVVLDTRSVDMGLIMMAWGTPYEFLLLSECELNRPASIIIDEHPRRLEWARGADATLVVNWNVFPYKDLPRRYFNFADTVSGYAIVPDR